MLNPQRVIISQYLSSPIMRALLQDWNDCIDPEVNLLLFYNSIWNILTAEGYGLDVWGRIVGVTRYVVAGEASNTWLGFAGTPYQPFGIGTWYDGSPLAPTHTTLPDEQFRTLILLKAFINLSNCSAKTINTILTTLYSSRGRAYVTDNQDMSIAYNFKFPMSAVDFAVLNNGILAGPAGVAYTISQGV